MNYEIISRQMRQVDAFPLIVVFTEKNGGRFFICEHAGDVGDVGRKVLRERLEDEGFWYAEDDEIKEAQAALERSRNDPLRAMAFLLDRSGAEYEGVQVVEPERIDD